MIIGIDPGLAGGVAALGGTGSQDVLKTWRMPVVEDSSGREIDTKAFKDILGEIYLNFGLIELAVMEKVSARPSQGTKCSPKQGSRGTFVFGGAYYTVRGMLRLFNVPRVYIPPQTWKSNVLVGCKNKDKADTIRFLQDRYPGINLLATPRSKVPHDGIADAICLAIYGWNSQQTPQKSQAE
mgnify:FL=1